MANKRDNPRPIFKSKSAAEKLLESPLSPPSSSADADKKPGNRKRELKRTTSYYRPEQVRFMRTYCESLRKRFNNENIRAPLLERVLLEIWDDDTTRKVEDYLRKNGFDKSDK
ncbi:MAG: hypothetical protein ACYDER_01195 [Ktedonobacteraceae bacterium]